MLRLAAISCLILVLFGGCRKDPEHKITYTVNETSQDNPSYNITYTSDKSGATTQANSSSASWSSGGIILNQDQFISMTVDCTAPTFEFIICVYVNGNLWDRKVMQDPTPSMTISGKP
jgi:hypothetical protein